MRRGAVDWLCSTGSSHADLLATNQFGGLAVIDLESRFDTAGALGPDAPNSRSVGRIPRRVPVKGCLSTRPSLRGGCR